jgi:ligand-binding sensor domain-containing protein/signal transduction histidine kinase
MPSATTFLVVVGGLVLTVAGGWPGRIAGSAQDRPPATTLRAGPLPPSATFTHLTTEQGLADQTAGEIAQDAEGFIWIGTFNGLDRFDGYQFVHYRHDDADEHSLSGNVISALYADRDGYIWVGSRGTGVDRLDQRTQQFEHFSHDPSDPNSLASNSPHMVLEDASGLIWIATEGGLSRFDPERRTFTNYRHDPSDPNSLSNDAVRSLMEDRSGALWIGTADGLNRLDLASGTFKIYRHDDADPRSLGDNGIWKIVQDHAGVVWAATENGLERYDPPTDEFIHYRHDPTDPHGLSSDSLDALLEDDAGRLWVGTFGAGVSILDAERQSFTNYHNDPGDATSLSYDQIDKVFRDRSGLMWLGTGGGGVDIYNPQQQAVTLYRSTPGDAHSLASPFVTAVLEDQDRAIWVGTRNRGLERIDRPSGEVTHFPPLPGVPGELGYPAVVDLQQDRDGALWIATYGGGLYRRDPVTGVFTAYRHDPGNPSSLSHDNVRKLRFDEQGVLWVATTGGGLDRFDAASGTFTAYRADAANPRALANDLTVGLAADQHGSIWVGTSGDGLQQLNIATGEFTRYHHDPRDPNSLSENNVFAIYVDRGGMVWVGTQGGGLNRLDPERGTFTQYHQRDGLLSERVQSIVEDGNPDDPAPGNLWIVTDRGLSRLDPSRSTFHNYDAASGLPRSQYTLGSSVSRTGELLIANLEGLLVFDPNAFRDDAAVPPIVLTDLRVNNEPASSAEAIDSISQIDLSNADRVISFEFAALNYRAPDRNRYRYKLEGFDGDWMEVDATHRVATYTNLDPGSYRFRVTGSNADGVWNDTGRTIGLSVAPPWWASWWFRGLTLVLIVGALGGVYVWRERTLSAQRRQLEALVGERTRALEAALATRDAFLRTLAHDLKAPIVSLAWYVNLLSRRVREDRLDRETLEANLQAINQGANEAVAAIDELHDLTRLASGETVPLHREPVDLVELVSSRVNVRRDTSRQRWSFESTEPSVVVDGDRARLGRVLDNLLDNAAKYSPAEKPVHVLVDRETVDDRSWAVVQVTDQGIGIPAADLPGIFERYHRGSNVASIPGEGLGLTSARQLVALHAGTLEVRSQEGAGSTFTLRLPVTSDVSAVVEVAPAGGSTVTGD